VFLTGTTGFVGKVLLEKFIRSTPDFRKIFVMVRPKKKMTVQERLDSEILSSYLFQVLFKERPHLK
jgi:fatty acyl-CoA reductase